MLIPITDDQKKEFERNRISEYDNELKSVGGTSYLNRPVVRPGEAGSGSFETDTPLAIRRVRILKGQIVCTVRWQARTLNQTSPSNLFLDGFIPYESEYTNTEVKEKGHALLLCNFYEKILKVRHN